nr:hypothetical protein [Tanacetum cinerariifolium]
MKNLDHDPIVLTGRHVAINIATVSYEVMAFNYYPRNLKLISSVALVVMFPVLTQIAQLKFPKDSPFETHSFFTYTGVVAFVVAIPASITYFELMNYLESLRNGCLTHIYYICMIVRCVFCISVIFAPLSFVLVLLIPKDGYYWIGYFNVSLLFVGIVSYNVNDYINLLCKKSLSNIGGVYRDERHHHLRPPPARQNPQQAYKPDYQFGYPQGKGNTFYEGYGEYHNSHWTLQPAWTESGVMLVLPADQGLWSDVISRWESITINRLNSQTWSDNKAKLAFVENLLEESEKLIWQQWRTAYPGAYSALN